MGKVGSFLCLLMCFTSATYAQSDVDAVLNRHQAEVQRAEQERLAAVAKSRVNSIRLLERQASTAYSRKDRLQETAAWRAVLTLDRQHKRGRQYFTDLGILDSVLKELPNLSTQAPLPGKWVTKYATTKVTTEFNVSLDGQLEIHFRDKPVGRATLQMTDGVAVIPMPHTDVIERWTFLSNRILVEHWVPRKTYYDEKPPALIGIAVRKE